MTFHRGNIRQKLGLRGTGTSLSEVRVNTVIAPTQTTMRVDIPVRLKGPYKPDVSALLSDIEVQSDSPYGESGLPDET